MVVSQSRGARFEAFCVVVGVRHVQEWQFTTVQGEREEMGFARVVAT